MEGEGVTAELRPSPGKTAVGCCGHESPSSDMEVGQIELSSLLASR